MKRPISFLVPEPIMWVCFFLLYRTVTSIDWEEYLFAQEAVTAWEMEMEANSIPSAKFKEIGYIIMILFLWLIFHNFFNLPPDMDLPVTGDVITEIAESCDSEEEEI